MFGGTSNLFIARLFIGVKYVKTEDARKLKT